MPQTDIEHSCCRFLAGALLGCSLLLSGCAGISGIEPQSRAMPADRLDAGKAVAGAPHIDWPEENWWRAYGDPQLDALVARGIAGSPTLRVVQARVRLANAYAETVHAETQPDVSLDASATREKFTALQFIPPPWAGHTDWNNEATVSLAYDLDLWGRKANGWNAALDEAHAAAAEAQQVRLELETSIVRSYIRLAEEFALRDVAEASLGLVRQRTAIAQRGLAAGLGTQMEVREAETALPMAVARIDAIDTRIRLQRNQLAALAGEGPGGGEGITRPTLALDVPVGLPDVLPAALIGRRPDVLASRWRVEAAERHVEVAKASFYPNINLLGFVGFQALGFGQLASDAATVAGVGPAVSLPLFDAGRRRSDVAAGTAAYDVAVESYNDVMVRALQQVSDQLALMQSGARRREEARQSLVSAEEASRLAQAGYRAGLSNYQHVLDAQAVLFRQQEFAAQVQAEWLDAHAGLMQALGGGMNPPEPDSRSNADARP